ncbi:hypothetical protein Goklo_028271, partial [Gossypium klotzschianum]|nr:hypothetical protein [Gossypium klotzschianum]
KLSEKSKGFERGHNFNKGKKNVAAISNKIPKEKKKRIQCYKCQGYDHTQVGCANALKNKMQLFIAWSDDASTSEHDEDEVHLSNYVAFISKVVTKVSIDLVNYNDSDIESTDYFMDNY